MAQIRPIKLTCPTCGFAMHHDLEPYEGIPFVTLIYCHPEKGGCDTHYAAEIHVTVTVEAFVCRLALPSTTVVDCLVDAERHPGEPPF